MANVSVSADPNSVDYGQLSLQIINIAIVTISLLLFLATKIKTMMSMCLEGQTATEKKLDGVQQSVILNIGELRTTVQELRAVSTDHIGELKDTVHALRAEVKAASSGSKESPATSVMSDSKTSDISRHEP